MWTPVFSPERCAVRCALLCTLPSTRHIRSVVVAAVVADIGEVRLLLPVGRCLRRHLSVISRPASLTGALRLSTPGGVVESAPFPARLAWAPLSSPWKGPLVVPLLASGALEGVECDVLGPCDALLAVGRFEMETVVDEALEGAALMRRDSLLAWLITPRVRFRRLLEVQGSVSVSFVVGARPGRLPSLCRRHLLPCLKGVSSLASARYAPADTVRRVHSDASWLQSYRVPVGHGHAP